MAVLDDPTQQDDQTAGGKAPSTAPAGNSAPTGGAASSSNSSGRFNNVQKYLDANKDFNADKGGLAGTISGNIQNQATNTQNNFQGAQKSFNDASGNAASGFNNYKQDLTNYQNQGAAGFAGNQNNVNAFQNDLNAQYTGPKSLQDLSGNQNLSNLQLQSKNIQNELNQTQTEGGRYNLLNNMFGKSDYSGGQRSLDNLILQNTPGQQSQFNQARGIAANTQQSLNNANQQSQNTAQNYENTAQQARQAVGGQLNQDVAKAGQDLSGQVSKAQSDQSAALQGNISALKSGNINSDLANQLGLQAGQSLWGLDPTTLQAGAGPTVGTVANADQYKQFGALSQLLGNNASADQQQTLGQLNQANAGQAGSFNANAMNTDAFKSSLQDATNKASAQLAPLESYNQQAGGIYNQMLNGQLNGNNGALQNAQNNYQTNVDKYNNLLSMLGGQTLQVNGQGGQHGNYGTGGLSSFNTQQGPGMFDNSPHFDNQPEPTDNSGGGGG